MEFWILLGSFLQVTTIAVLPWLCTAAAVFVAMVGATWADKILARRGRDGV